MIRLINEDTENGEFAIDLIMISKYFERIGDHATNIAEWVVFPLPASMWRKNNDLLCRGR